MYKEFSKEKIRKIEGEIEDFFKKNKRLDSYRIPNFDIIQLCSSLGFKMLSLNLPKEIDGIILVKNGAKAIGVSNRVNPKDSRFVVAHELAHYIHASKGKADADVIFAMKDSILHDKEKTDEENIMDLMAAAILVPQKMFVADMKENEINYVSSFEEAKNVSFGKIDSLATKYNVNKIMIIRRIYEVSCCVDWE